jgi:hypothetical protein
MTELYWFLSEAKVVELQCNLGSKILSIQGSLLGSKCNLLGSNMDSMMDC